MMTLMRVGVMLSCVNGLGHVTGEWTAPSTLLHLAQDTPSQQQYYKLARMTFSSFSLVV